jgi:DNA (cytosine-5)-methyltransferase 1
MADGVADRVDRVKAIGNGQVPFVAALAFLILSSRFEGRNLVENQG